MPGETPGSEEPFPQHMHRAFLLALECDYFLEMLEQKNFNVFEPDFR